MTTAVNLSLRPVELDPENGPGVLWPATDDAEGRDRRELKKVTDREKSLANAGTIALEDDNGRKRGALKSAPAPVLPEPTEEG